MAGGSLPDVFFCVAGSFLTSCGWVDALLYTLTRRVFVNSDMSSHGAYNRTNATGPNAQRPGDDYGMNTIGKEVGRTVTIVGGTSRLSRMVDKKKRYPNGLTEHSASGSQDSIIKPMAGTHGIAILTETNIQVESAPASARDSDDLSQRHDSEGGISKH